MIWIDWYPYHVARFSGLQAAAGKESVAGIELVGGVGVHAGLTFREDLGSGMGVETLRPKANWHTVSKVGLSFSLLKALSRIDPEVVLVPGYYTLPAFAAMLWAHARRRTCVLMTETTATDHLRIAWKERLKSKLIRTMFDWALTGGSAHVRYLRATRLSKRAHRPLLRCRRERAHAGQCGPAARAFVSRGSCFA